MKMNDYQIEALRTARDADAQLPPTWYLALGLNGEAGEVADLLKKQERHGKAVDLDEMRAELGDVLWYVATMAAAYGLTLSDVAAANVAKLRARYPDGFVERFSGSEAVRCAECEIEIAGVPADVWGEAMCDECADEVLSS